MKPYGNNDFQMPEEKEEEDLKGFRLNIDDLKNLRSIFGVESLTCL
jgi:hypothetical protein